ncbi:hypothetical protein HGRIS_006528 [Hohenbuehelia grisea]|uniref:Uncharacterized protein n=1 Tax=Hohenbuehelia grisea TaxID=104357 RepID=A0ABR3J9V3_9AGAR
MMPYVYFIRNDHHDLKPVRWLYPASRCIGSFLVAVIVQFIIQIRLMEIVRYRILFLQLDAIAKDLNRQIDLPSWWDPKYSSEVTLWKLVKPPTWWEKKLRAHRTSRDPDDPDDDPKAQVLEAELDKKMKERMGEKLKEAQDELKLWELRQDPKKAQNEVELQMLGQEPENAQDPEMGPMSSTRDQSRAKKGLMCRALLAPWNTAMLKKAQRKVRHLERKLDHPVLSQMNGEGPLTIFIRWICIVFTIIGIGLSIWGYVTSFTIVKKNSDPQKGPLIWLGIEIALSLLRMFIWSLDPVFDETHLTFTLKLNSGHAVSTPGNNFYDELELEPGAVIPQLSSSEFLGHITSFVGLINPLEGSLKGITVYYAMARSNRPRPNELKLYVTLHNYMTNILRTFIWRSDGTMTCYRANLDVQDHETVNAGRIEAKLGPTTTSADTDQVMGHCKTIFAKLEAAQSEETIDQTWELAETRSKKPEEIQTSSHSAPNSGGDDQLDDRIYLRLGELERSKRAFCSARSRQLSARLEVSPPHIFSHSSSLIRPLAEVGTEAAHLGRLLVLYEWQFMEQMLVYESRQLETILLSSSQTMILRLEQKAAGRLAAALAKEQTSRAVRRVSNEQARAEK